MFTTKDGSKSKLTLLCFQWKIVPHADTKDDTKYQVKNDIYLE